MLEIADASCQSAIHSKEIGGALRVNFEEGTPHQEVRRFSGDVLSELGESLRGDHAGQPALAGRDT